METSLAPAPVPTHPTTFEKHELLTDHNQAGPNTSYRPHDVLAEFNYYKDAADGQLPPPYYVTKPESLGFSLDTKTVTVRDIRGDEDRYTLDTIGFQVLRHVSKEKEFEDSEITKVYYPEMESLLKSTTGASTVLVFEHTVRRPRPSQGGDGKTPKTARPREPVKLVHIDRSYDTVPATVRRFFPHDAERLLKSRHQIINAWRPIKTIYKDPLGVIDATSISEADLIPQKLVFPDRIDEGLNVRFNPSHQWFYLREHTPAEVMLFKIFESKTDGRARGVPHSAFANPEFEAEAPRESIEVRALVFYDHSE